MTITRSLVASACALAFAGACIQKDQPPAAMAKAIPTHDQVAIKLPTAAARIATPAVGQLSNFYVFTREVTETFNGGSAWVLIMVHTIVEYPVTSIHGDTYEWGPWTGDALDPGIYKLDVTANADGTYDYVLSGHAKSDTTATFLALIGGHADPNGTGSFGLDFDAARAVDPITNANNKGQVGVTYDIAARHLALAIKSTDASGNPVAAEYVYDGDATGGGDMTFNVLDANLGAMTAADLTVRSRWLATGAGRSDARVALSTGAQAIASECWSGAFLEVYYTDSANINPTVGDASQCAFTDVDLPPL